jgi:ATP-binding cassette, subfamily B, bacterial
MQKIIDNIAQEPTIYMFRMMWRFSKGNRRAVVAFLFLYVLSNATALLTPLIFAWFVNEIQMNGVSYDNVMKLSLIAFLPIATTLLFWLFHGTARILEQKNAILLEINYRTHFLTGILGLGMQWHNHRDSGDTIDKINKAVRSLFTFSEHLFEIARIIFGIIGAVFVLYFFNAYIAIAVFIAIVIALYVLSRFDKELVRRRKDLNNVDNKIAAGVFDTISNITTVLILNIQQAVLKRVHTLLVAPIEKAAQHAKINELKWFSGSVMFELIAVIPIIFYLFFELHHGRVIAIGTITALYMYLNRMSDSFFSFSYMYESIMYGKAGVENAKEIEQAIEANTTTTKKRGIGAWSVIDIQNLRFSYEHKTPNNSNHLDDIQLHITRGERIACIGKSGSGKTTFLKVLHGLYASTQATVHFGTGKTMQTNFADIDLETMLVPQEPEVFSSTIRENITLGLGYSKKDIARVMQLAQFTDVIAQLPKGLKSVINEKGVNLSGGQKQRLALARALLFAQDKDVILLDESTSSVDPENEQKIYENIFHEFTDKTILASIHKMNLLKFFDRIVIFENGTIVDKGTFDELLRRNEKFARDWQEFIRMSE